MRSGRERREEVMVADWEVIEEGGMERRRGVREVRRARLVRRRVGADMLVMGGSVGVVLWISDWGREEAEEVGGVSDEFVISLFVMESVMFEWC